jgi:glycosyltransferase involved in cell wall biosynthesis
LRGFAGGDAPTLSIAELRALPLRALLRRLFAIRGRILIAVEDVNSAALVPMLRLLTVPTRAREVLLVDHALTPRPVRRGDLPRVMLSLAKASWQGFAARRRAEREMAALLRAQRIDGVPGAGSSLLYLNTNLWFGVKAGGSVGHIAGVVKAFRRAGYGIDFTSWEPPALVADDVRLRPVALQGTVGFPAENNLYRFHHAVVQAGLDLIRSPYAFLYHRLSLANYAGVPLARAARLPLVLEYNGSEVWAARNWGRPLRYQATARAAEDVCLRHASIVVTVSEILQDELVSRGVEPQRIVCYPNCIDPQVFDPGRFPLAEQRALRQSLGIANDALVVTFIGTFGRWHGIELLARTVRRLVDDDAEGLAGARLHFLLIGDGALMPEVRALVSGEKYRRFCTLTGLVPQAMAPQYLAASDIFVSPHVPNPDGSRFFGSPTKLFEYMAMGKPIIASDLEQIGEVLANSLRVEQLPEYPPNAGESRLAILATPGSADELGCAVFFLARHPEWRQRLGENARRECLQRYTWDRHIAAILERIKGLTGHGLDSAATAGAPHRQMPAGVP